MVNVAKMKNVDVSMNFAPIVVKTACQCFVSVSNSGTLTVSPDATTFWNEGVSPIPFRIHKPTKTSTILSKNGILHP